MSKKTFTKQDIDILEMLAEYKWGDTFTCLKCGKQNEVIKSEYHSGRRCKCKTDESVPAHTIFDSNNLSIEKLYGILKYVDDNAKRDWKEQILTIRRHDSISPKDFAVAYERGEISKANFDRQIGEWAHDTKISITHTAKVFGVEENSIRLLFEKIDSRIEDSGSDNLNIRIMDFFASHDWEYNLGLLMFPMRKDDEWNRGVLKKDGKTYQVRPQPFIRNEDERKGLAWRLVEVEE